MDKELLLFFFIIMFYNGEALSHRFRLHNKEKSQYMFLMIQDAFYQCPSPKVLDGESMGTTNYDGAVKNCVNDPECKYFEFNKENSQIYICTDTKGYASASPNTSWIIGVKPSTLEQPHFKVIPNQQAVCDDVVFEKSVATLEDATRVLKEQEADFFTYNLNQGSSVGPGIASKLAFFCRGRKKVLLRNGFLIVERTNESGIPPMEPPTYQAPCGLNGSIQSDSSRTKEGIAPGQIVEAKRITGIEK